MQGIKEAIRKEDVGFFTAWEAEEKRDESFSAAKFNPAESLRYFDLFGAFIDLHGSAHVSHMVVGLVVEAVVAIDALGAEAHGYLCHFSVRDAMHRAYNKDKREPEEDTLYWVMGQKDAQWDAHQLRRAAGWLWRRVGTRKEGRRRRWMGGRRHKSCV